MTAMRVGPRFLRFSAMVLGVFFAVAPASAQWTPVEEIPATKVFSVRANGDTISAGVDTAVYVSTDAGKHWQRSAKPVNGVTSIQVSLMRNGRLYAGTFGQGVFISDDLGASWQAFNQGLVGGILDSQLFISGLEARGDSLYAATEGAGMYVRRLDGPSAWQHFGDVFEPNQASNVNELALGGTRLLASAGSNGFVFVEDPGEADWTISHLDNVGIHAGLQAQSAAFTGAGWVVGTALGVFRSVDGGEPWQVNDLRLGPILFTAFATQGHQLFAAFDIPDFAVMAQSNDDGASWLETDSFFHVFVVGMAVAGNEVYAARGDGLWRNPLETASVPSGGDSRALRFALTGPQPVRDQARLRFELPAAGIASIDVFDVSGRRVADRIQGSWSSGPHEVSLNTGRLDPGVYAARIVAGGAQGVVRLVHIR